MQVLVDLFHQVPYAVPVAVIVIAVAVFYTQFNKKSVKPSLKHVSHEYLANFNPEPLIDAKELPTGADFPVERHEPDGDDPDCLNLAKVNYYNLLNKEDTKIVAENCIMSNGVGSCGPRGFYGTIDIHLNLEKRIAEFMGMEDTILYSYGFSTMASAIGAYCKKFDILFCDEKISFSAQQGCVAAKSKVVYFKHNNTKDLEEKLMEYEQQELKRKKLFRKFLIVEGIYQRTGTISPLPELMRLRKKYKLRIFLDESVSFGVLGETGRGVTEHFNIDRCDVDMIVGSLEGSVGSIGGFCVGATVVIEHQRLSGLGYCFSASLPPFLSQISISALDMFERNPDVFEKLRHISSALNTQLQTLDSYRILSSPESPLKVIQIKTGEDVLGTVKNVQNFCGERKMYLARYEDSLQLNVNVSMTNVEIGKIVSILRDASRLVP